MARLRLGLLALKSSNEVSLSVRASENCRVNRSEMQDLDTQASVEALADRHDSANP